MYLKDKRISLLFRAMDAPVTFCLGHTLNNGVEEVAGCARRAECVREYTNTSTNGKML
jgi:hypothetical protein